MDRICALPLHCQLAMIDHLARVPLRCSSRDAVVFRVAAIADAVAAYSTCGEAARLRRLQAAGLEHVCAKSLQQLRAMLPAQQLGGPGSLLPRDLLTSAGQVPGVVLCWGGSEAVVERLLALLGSGQLLEAEVTARHLVVLQQAGEREALALLAEYVSSLQYERGRGRQALGLFLTLACGGSAQADSEQLWRVGTAPLG
jgi:hypothetical protein